MSGSHALKRRAVCFHRPAYTKITKNMNVALFQEKMQRLQMQKGQARQELEATEQAAQAVNAKRQILEQYLDRECTNVASLKKSAPEM